MMLSVLLIFAAVFLGSFAVFHAVSALRRTAELKGRLRRIAQGPGDAAPELSGQGLLRETTGAEKFLSRLPLVRSVKKLVELSGVKLSLPQFLLATGTLSALGFLAIFAWKGSGLVALPAALAIGFLPLAYLAHLKRQRSALFAEQLPDALTMVARSLRAGHSLAAAVELISQELPEPAGGLFKIAYEQQRFGMRMADSLRSLRGKVDSTDFNFFVTIIRINNETGGNLSEILEKLAETIRSRLQIRRQVQVYTAEGRFSGYVLVALPVAVFAAFYLLRPGYMSVFFTEPVCQRILAGALLAQVIGFLMIRKIIDIRI